MTEWSVVLVISELAILLLGVMAPVLKLNSTITALSESLKTASKELNDLEAEDKAIREHNAEAHRRIHARIDEDTRTLQDHDRRLQDHDTRITYLEKEREN